MQDCLALPWSTGDIIWQEPDQGTQKSTNTGTSYLSTPAHKKTPHLLTKKIYKKMWCGGVDFRYDAPSTLHLLSDQK
ncbi:MAG: hypothetical protein COU32_03525 [Candidatus Magasanikbacteria bacterium CG10_big_fil_rev_8_21_14_0_10_42_10]|uniref:Uncharacterized protein n=2 Tax=Candidatus Magasanikiibacteriota TaxID=1752731 RepID=A0A2H0TVL9_9BACT|nr:MAG: hypothetical protein COU32_03525 [Candidatus Magasanikbacteria bacterium CG10_big_fil_rev_8_21_14_0_10_42_10]PIZ94160.1 MAG: hypothetical protein COX82_01225 [Candidatus Magasanikbacteria bacterium CG_4_10_14_0_2_um_filter_41_10]